MAAQKHEDFMPEKDSKTCSTVIFPKKHPDSGDLQPNQRHKVQTWFIEYENCFGHLTGTSSKCNKFWGQNQNLTNQYF